MKNKKSKRKDIVLLSALSFKIKMLRVALGLSQAELDKRTGLRTYKYESGEQEMTATTIGIFSAALQIEPYQLFKID